MRRLPAVDLLGANRIGMVCGTKGADRGDPHELCEMYRFVDGTGAKVTCCFECRWRVTTADTVAEVARDLGVLK